jgi:hypothetical protein
MRRRRFIQALAAAPAAPALLAQQAAQPPATAASAAIPPPDPAPLDFSVPDEAGDPVLKFFGAKHSANLRRLCDLLVPGAPGVPGAVDAHVPEFMDFLIGDSTLERQAFWLRGLDALETQSQARFAKTFADTDAVQAAALLAPLHQPWTPGPLTDPVARLLIGAKDEIRTATLNSYERNAGAPGTARRRGGGGLYWLPVE